MQRKTRDPRTNPGPGSRWLTVSMVLVPVIAILIGTPSCSVVRRSRDCERLSTTIDKFAPKLKTPLGANPNAELVFERGKILRKLGSELSKVPLKTTSLKAPRHEIAEHLDAIANDLDEAGRAVAELSRSTEQNQKAKSQAERNQQRDLTRTYLRMKSDVDSHKTKVEQSMRRLQEACR